MTSKNELAEIVRQLAQRLREDAELVNIPAIRGEVPLGWSIVRLQFGLVDRIIRAASTEGNDHS